MLFRNRRLVRTIASYLLLQTISSIVFPTISKAMTGPGQPEFATYEAPGATDLVDLATGDFSYRLPILDIPGPERGFSLPLAYSAGIQLEQEASWVGLGWSLNPGAITRNINGYPDDADAYKVETTFNKNVQSGWQGGFPGVLDLSWNSISGHAGTVSFLGLQDVSWDDNGLTGGETLGIKYSGSGVTGFNPLKMITGVAMLAGVTGVGGESVKAAAERVNGIGMAGSMVANALYDRITPTYLGGVAGYNNQPTRDIEHHDWYDNYWDYYNANSTETAYGSLWFGNMPNLVQSANTSKIPNSPNINTATQATSVKANLFNYTRLVNQPVNGRAGNWFYETAADIYQDGSEKKPADNLPFKGHYINLDDNRYWESSQRPISIAHDNFKVMGEGVTGSIRPYRLDVGSVAYPKLGTGIAKMSSYDNYTGVSHYKYNVSPFLNSLTYKPGFRYDNSHSNGYTYHKYAPASGNAATGFNVNPANANAGETMSSLTITDPRLDFSSVRTSQAIETTRKGLHNTYAGTNTPSDMQLVQGKHVNWYSNKEIIMMSNSGANNSNNTFLEFESPVSNNLTGYAANRNFRLQLPPNGIGAFAVTAEDGTTYHYSLPVYQYQTYTEANEVQTSTTIGQLGKSTRREGMATQSLAGGTSASAGGRATAWLLTAITSSDYIDTNNSKTVDAGDWGGWVKFNYGLFSSRYKWRQPYIGTSYSDEDNVISNKAFVEGYKQTYYLNSISTRTHTALFIKSVRQDGRGHFTPSTSYVSNLGINEQVPASSLRLDEVILLDNGTLAQLGQADAIKETGDTNPATIPALTTATGSAYTFTDGPLNGSGDEMGNVLDQHDLDGDARIRKFVEAKALKRVHFNYDYDLCRGTPSSFSCPSNNPSLLPPMTEAGSAVNRGGKLTLKSVSFFGPTINNAPTKIIPDFSFSYEKAGVDKQVTNPVYKKENWDAFGMYTASGKEDITSHHPVDGAYPAPWTLTQITDPLGGKTTVTYERDTYSQVSEFGSTKLHITGNGCSRTYNLSSSSIGYDLTKAFKQGQTVYLIGSAKKAVIPIAILNYWNYAAQVESVTPSTITFVGNKYPFNYNNQNNDCNNLTVDFDLVVPKNKVGGDIRVAALSVSDGTHSYQTRYQYTLPTGSTDPLYNSSGVLAQEPAFLDRFDLPIYGVTDYPNTPIMYSMVTVLRGLFRNDDSNDFESRQVYSFYTPTSDMVSETVPGWQKALQNVDSPPVFTTNNQTTVDIGRIGQIKKLVTYNQQGQQETSTEFNYSSSIPNADGIPNQGHYTEGVINNERFGNSIPYYLINRSTKEYVPTVLDGTRTTRNGISTSSQNLLYDFYTGQVLESSSTDGKGITRHMRTIPAYTLSAYGAMGPKGDGLTNRNMMSQARANYSFVENPAGPAYDITDPLNPQTSRVLSAAVQTWWPTWTNYREADANGAYQDVAGQTPVWRQAASYLWQSSLLNTDGSYKDFANFNWSGNPNSHWLKSGEAVRYDHFSHTLEARDVNGSYVVQKAGYGQAQMTVSGTNARYTELAYSGAEDQTTVAGAIHFGGEVVAGASGNLDNQRAHTGFYSYQAAAGQKGFMYRAQIGRDVDGGKQYKVSVWAHANASSGKLYASVNGSRIAESSRTSPATKKAGDWYLLTLLVTVPISMNGQTIEFGCANDSPSTPANFDDFRLAPLTATVTSRVYDPRSNLLLYSLDNDNLFTHYEYTPTGRLKRVYRETLDGTGKSTAAQKLVKEYDYNYAMLYVPTWLSVEYRCATDAGGNYTGVEERKVADVNPLHIPASASYWEPFGSSLACARPTCTPSSDGQPWRLQGNVCEYAQQAGSDCISCSPQSAGQMSVFHWQWADGTSAGDTYSDCANACLSYRQLVEKGLPMRKTPPPGVTLPRKSVKSAK